MNHFPIDRSMPAIAAALMALTATPLAAQINAGAIKPETSLPFTVTQVATFNTPWRIAFLPDGRMLVTEKPGGLWLVSQKGAKVPVAGAPAVLFKGQGGMLGVYTAPTFAADHGIYLTYAEPGEGGSGLALAHAKLVIEGGKARLDHLNVIWRDLPRGKGGQFGAAVAFSPDHKYLFLTVGDRQRMTPAQNPDSPLGKILRLTLDGKPAPGNPGAGRAGAATLTLIDPPKDTEAAKTAPVIETYKVPGINQAPAEIWTSGHRTPYGLSFAPDGRLWEVEHGPKGGDELNLIEPEKNYGWPLVSYAVNYDDVPIPSPDTRPDLQKPVIYWTPVIAPGNLMFYHGALFRGWRGSALISGLGSMSLNRVTFDAAGKAKPAERWALGFRVRDIAEAPDGALWAVEDANPGKLVRLTPKVAARAARR